MIRSHVVICASVGCMALAAPAWARPKVVALTPIENDDAGTIRAAVSDALDSDELALVSEKKLTKAIDKLHEGALTAKDAKKLAKDLEADAVVQGTLSEDGASKSLHFKLFVHGKETKGFTVAFKNANSEKFKTALKNKMVEKIAGEPPPEEEEAEAEPAPPKKKKHVVEEDDEAEAPRHKKKKVATVDDDESLTTEGTVSQGGASLHSANHAAVRLDLGASVANRTLAFTARDYPQAPKDYTQSPVPGARIEGELYPFAFGNPTGAAGGLGIGGDYDKTISLNLTVKKMDAAPQSVAAKQSHWSIGPRYRISFGKLPTSPTLTIGVGYGKQSFTTNRSTLALPTDLDVPDTEYTLIDPSLTLRLPVVKAVAFVVGGRGMIITKAGSITTAEQYGQGSVYGAAAHAGVDFVLGSHFAIKLEGEFTQVGFTFKGVGAMSNSRDNDASSKDIGGATDRSIGAAATLAVLY